MTLLGPGGHEGRGVFGPRQGADGAWMHRGTHYCSKTSCTQPAVVAVFGKLTSSAGWARFDVCRPHVEPAMREFVNYDDGAFMAALSTVDPRDIGGYCPHCGAAAADIAGEGRGHMRSCPIGLSWPDRAREAGVPWVVHAKAECEVCVAWIGRIPGPAG